jgi:hypothetical protein
MKALTGLNVKIILPALVLMLAFYQEASAQKDSIFRRKPIDTAATRMNQEALFNRPFIYLGRTTTAIGGYLEGNTNYFATDGVPEGFSMEMRRFNIFLYSTIARKIKFLSEIEFEHGAEEISLETAFLDYEFNTAFNFRTGIIIAPIGAFNQNHDAPRWEFIERPLVATQIIPSTLSDIGFGVHGKLYGHQKIFTYDAYLVNGLRDEVILNNEGRTFLGAGKSPEMFAEDNNGIPSFTGKVAFRQRKIGEIGLSFYGGTYNTYRLDGIKVSEKRNLAIYALDFNSTLKGRIALNGEFAFSTIDIPAATGQFYGNKQWGGYVEAVCPVMKRNLGGFENSVLNVNLRVEAIDYNIGKFEDTGTKIYDEIKAIVPGVSLRLAAGTVLRANYRYHWTQDILGNPAEKTAGFQFGFASYF